VKKNLLTDEKLRFMIKKSLSKASAVPSKPKPVDSGEEIKHLNFLTNRRLRDIKGKSENSVAVFIATCHQEFQIQPVFTFK
jgi:hypothetical protein